MPGAASSSASSLDFEYTVFPVKLAAVQWFSMIARSPPIQ